MKFDEYLKEDHFEEGQKVMTPEGKGVVVSSESDGGEEVYTVELDNGEMEIFEPSDLKAAEREVEKKITESVSDSDIKKAKEVGHATAKEIFGDEYDKEKAEKLIDDVIKKNKDKAKDGEDLSGIVAGHFR